MEKDEFNNKISDIVSYFDDIKQRIGAKDTGFVIVPRELKTPTGKFNAGKPITGAELQRISKNWKSKDPLIDEEGNAFVLYIPDFTSNHYRRGFSPENLPKYHTSWCWTLDNMKESGRMKRYIKKTDIETNIFKGKKDGDRNIESVLYACQNCRKTLEDIYGRNMYFDVKNMDMLKFFSLYGKHYLYDPKVKKPYSVMYPKHWDEISKKYREKANWKCDQCGESFANNKKELDVHHINGIKSDVRDTNLKVLCKKHHAEQPMHSHYNKIIN
ncbi:MAG: HNH endonuclease [Candidatus Paceibacterota bacterium]